MNNEVTYENLKKITSWLIDNGWVDVSYGDRTDFLSSDMKFKTRIYIVKKPNPEFKVDVAMLCTFDRWANSGIITRYSTCNEVIEFFKGEYKISAFEETLSLLRDEIEQDFMLNSEADKLLDTMMTSIGDWFHSADNEDEMF